MTPGDPVAALRNLASALSECDECQAPTIDDADGPNSLCGKCWERHKALSAEIERMKAGLETVRVAFGYTTGGPSAPVEMAEEIASLRAEVERLKADIAAWPPVCDEHKPGRWDGGDTCVVCEAHEERAELERLRAVIVGLRAELRSRAVLNWTGRASALQVLIELDRLCDEHGVKEVPDAS